MGDESPPQSPEIDRDKIFPGLFEEQHLLTFAADSFPVVVAGLHGAFLWMLCRGERKAGSLWALLSMLRGWIVVRVLVSSVSLFLKGPLGDGASSGAQCEL